jgi:hypothetical protein
MKYKTTKKAVMNGYSDIICVGYCTLQHLLNCENEVAYTTRTEGWGADIYQFGNTAIVTGYAPFGTIRPAYEISKKYDDAAQEISLNYNLSWQERKTRLGALIEQYIKEVTNNA